MVLPDSNQGISEAFAEIANFSSFIFFKALCKLCFGNSTGDAVACKDYAK